MAEELDIRYRGGPARGDARLCLWCGHDTLEIVERSGPKEGQAHTSIGMVCNWCGSLNFVSPSEENAEEDWC